MKGNDTKEKDERAKICDAMTMAAIFLCIMIYATAIVVACDWKSLEDHPSKIAMMAVILVGSIFFVWSSKVGWKTGWMIYENDPEATDRGMRKQSATFWIGTAILVAGLVVGTVL